MRIKNKPEKNIRNVILPEINLKRNMVILESNNSIRNLKQIQPKNTFSQKNNFLGKRVKNQNKC